MNRFAAAVAIAVLASSVFAQGDLHKSAGIVKSVDAGAGTVNLAHDPIPSLKWPAMTMKFKAKEKAMVEKLKPGQKIEFSFVQVGKDYVLTEIR